MTDIKMADVFELPLIFHGDGYPLDSHERIYDEKGKWVLKIRERQLGNAIVVAVNNHDRLTAENAELKKEAADNEIIMDAHREMIAEADLHTDWKNTAKYNQKLNADLTTENAELKQQLGEAVGWLKNAVDSNITYEELLDWNGNVKTFLASIKEEFYKDDKDEADRKAD